MRVNAKKAQMNLNEINITYLLIKLKKNFFRTVVVSLKMRFAASLKFFETFAQFLFVKVTLQARVSHFYEVQVSPRIRVVGLIIPIIFLRIIWI